MQKHCWHAVLHMTVDDRLGGFGRLVPGKAHIIQNKVIALRPIRIIKALRSMCGIFPRGMIDGEFDLEPCAKAFRKDCLLSLKIMPPTARDKERLERFINDW